ncbi:MAG: hypothetical protein OSB62_06610 [Alphaproteobacteria bacterium]|nr:hypothetical protein [Alphaproteobacteria bacterium]
MTNTQEKRIALDAFIEHKARIDKMLERLQAASADHFEINPDSINWSDVGSLADIANDLQNITDRVCKEDEYA